MKLCTRQKAILIIMITIVLACIIWLLSPFLTPLVSDALWASVFATVVLIVINAIYVYETNQTVTEMKKAREAEFFPLIKAEVSWLGPAFLILKFTNYGKGPAIDINVNLTYEPSKETRLWQQKVMAPEEFIRVFLPEGNMDKVCNKSATIVVNGKYSDLFSNDFSINTTLDVKEFITQAKQLSQLVEPDINREVRSIKEELQKIERELGNIRRELKNPPRIIEEFRKRREQEEKEKPE